MGAFLLASITQWGYTGLAPPGPTAASLTQHLNRLGAHLAYGLETAVTTQLLRRLV